MKKTLLILLSILAMNNAHAFEITTKSDLKQNQLCQVNDMKKIKDCNEGDILMFTPSFFGNEQLPVLISGAACDFRYPIVTTKGGVSCVFTNQRLDKIK